MKPDLQTDLIGYLLVEFEKQHPGFTIGAIDLWGVDGRIQFERDGTYSQWLKRKAEIDQSAAGDG
jgi:hypothetical protein